MYKWYVVAICGGLRLQGLTRRFFRGIRDSVGLSMSIGLITRGVYRGRVIQFSSQGGVSNKYFVNLGTYVIHVGFAVPFQDRRGYNGGSVRRVKAYVIASCFLSFHFRYHARRVINDYLSVYATNYGGDLSCL